MFDAFTFKTKALQLAAKTERTPRILWLEQQQGTSGFADIFISGHTKITAYNMSKSSSEYALDKCP